MKNPQRLIRIFSRLSLVLGLILVRANLGAEESVKPAASEAIPWAELGARAQANYSGDGLDVRATHSGALLRAAFQKLEGDATAEGLWVRSAAEGEAGRFRVKATAVGRAGGEQNPLLGKGSVQVSEGKPVKFLRPRLVEEYSTSMDGLRQDFVVPSRPEGEGDLLVEISVDGARVEEAEYGARLVLESGRKIAYNRLKVLDAEDRELVARIRVVSESALTITVEDIEAVYPVRIDPTFCDENWVSMGGLPGSEGAIQATAIDAAGNLYVGSAAFSVIGEIRAERIAKWNGSSWSALGTGVAGNVLTLVASGTDLYVGGEFSSAGGVLANNIAKWNGVGWSALGLGVNAQVEALAISGGELYVGGAFTLAGGSSANRVAKWNGSGWSALGAGLNADVRSMALSGSTLYVGGDFTTAGGAAANRVARWNGSVWSAMSAGMNDSVYALAVSGSVVYAGGAFTSAGGVAANRIARWNGSAWFALGTGIGGSVLALRMSGGDLYAGGSFSQAGAITANNIAKWNGSSWSSLGSGTAGMVLDLSVAGSAIYVGGAFSKVGDKVARCIAQWNGSEWSALTKGIDGRVDAMAVFGDELYVGGWFAQVGSAPANRIAKWNGSTWAPLGEGVGGPVSALTAGPGGIYAGGSFVVAGGVQANRIARWDGSAWHALGTGMNGEVLALASSGNEVYAGGNFTSAGGNPANRVAKWNGASWTSLGTGVNSQVNALAVSGGNLYAAGWFTSAGGQPANRIAKWDGNAWSALGGGVNNGVHAIVASGSDLYAGGAFTMAGNVPANRIAKWDGVTWSALGGGLNDQVFAVAVRGSEVYATGFFREAGGGRFLARWSGSSWSGLGAGLSSVGFALTQWRTDLYIGGDFMTAGDKVSPYLARMALPAAPTVSLNGSMIPENVSGVIGVITASDADVCDEHLYSLVAGEGSGNNLAFSIDATGVLRLQVPADFENTPTLSIRLRATDSGGLFTESQFAITVTDVDEAPVAGADSVNRPNNSRVARVLKSVLLANDTDPEGGALALREVGNPTPAGATVAMLGNFVVFTAPSNTSGHGSFSYTVSDGGLTSTGTVAVVETNPESGEASPASAAIAGNGGSFVLTFIGVPGRSYAVQYTSDAGPVYTWSDFEPVAAYVAPDNGVFTHTDADPGDGMRLYRAISTSSNNN